MKIEYYIKRKQRKKACEETLRRFAPRTSDTHKMLSEIPNLPICLAGLKR